MFSTLSDALPQAKDGTIRMLVVSGETRSALAPEIPTVAESGYPNSKVLTLNGLMAAAGTPPDIIEKIANEIATAIKDPQV
jgi:tripartite-type tricarboxylate transporter receptor subunit TctC